MASVQSIHPFSSKDNTLLDTTQKLDVDVLQLKANAPKKPSLANASKMSKGSAAAGKAAGAKKNVDEGPETRQMFDKRQSRIKHRRPFMASIARWRERNEVTAHKALHFEAAGDKSDVGTGSVGVFVRKRPLFAHEAERDEFDVVTVSAETEVAIHNCQMHADMRRMFLTTKSFPCTTGFSDKASNRDVYQSSAVPIVTDAISGGVGAMFMYGQTGSGKTHTMTAIEEFAINDIFEAQGVVDVTMTYFEIAGKKCTDLLSDGSVEILLKELPARNGKEGAIQLMGATEATFKTRDELMQALEAGKARRATCATLCNANSSRSHAVLRLVIRQASSSGQLTLVDCAGSERREDTMFHTPEQRKEGAEINQSLYALKECVRLRMRKMQNKKGEHVHVPYRSSQLTKVLMECFVCPDAKLAVIGTVSPGCSDCEHSEATLKTVMLIGGGDLAEGLGTNELKEDVSPTLKIDDNGKVVDETHCATLPMRWTHKDVVDWISTTEQGKYAVCLEKLSDKATGRELVRMMPAVLTTLCKGDKALGAEMYAAIRAETTRVNAIKAKRTALARS